MNSNAVLRSIWFFVKNNKIYNLEDLIILDARRNKPRDDRIVEKKS